jgi:hypothetical protein
MTLLRPSAAFGRAALLAGLFAIVALLVVPSSRAEAMKIQVVKSPGGITAWLVEEHSVPLIALRFAFEAELRRTRRARKACRISWPACSMRALATSRPSNFRSAPKRSPCA